MYFLSLYSLALLLLRQHVAASLDGPGMISVNYGDSSDGCLDQTMKWVVDGNCGVFTAKTITGGSEFIYSPRGILSKSWYGHWAFRGHYCRRAGIAKGSYPK